MIGAIRAEVGDDVAVEVDAGKSEIRVDASADPQVVIFLIEGRGLVVEKVKG